MSEPAPARSPRNGPMLAEVAEGLSRPHKELSPKFFYDTRGSELFEQITRLPEYYPTRMERALLGSLMPGWMAELRPRSLVELGAGSAEKSRIILDAMVAAGTARAYVPVDVSAEFLREVADRLRAEYSELRVLPAVADITDPVDLPADLPHPVLHAFLGSTIGNFAPAEARGLLRRIRAGMHPSDQFLLGVDLRKDPATIEAAYNDSRGVTAEFNRNLLRVLNRELGADFQPDAFRHHAFYNSDEHCIEMHLVSLRPQRVTIPGAGNFDFREGESVRTEISCKHDRASVEAMFGAVGLHLERWETDANGFYALVLASPLP